MTRALVRAGAVSRRGALLGSLALGVPGAPSAPPGPPPSDPVWLDAAGAPLPFQSGAEIEAFLRSAPVVSSEPATHGRFGVRKARLELDSVAVHAAVRTYVEETREARVEGRLVRHFRDHFVHEPAAYGSVSDDELDECLEPYLPSLERLGLRERRRALVELIAERIARFGESAIVVDLDGVGPREWGVRAPRGSPGSGTLVLRRGGRTPAASQTLR